MKCNSSLSLLIFLFLAAACSSQVTFKEKKFILKNKETIRIKEVDLTITNNGCGRKWLSEKDRPLYEAPYCDLVIKKGDSTITGGADYKPIFIGNLEISLERINPWGATEDSIPPGGCRVWVKLHEGR